MKHIAFSSAFYMGSEKKIMNSLQLQATDRIAPIICENQLHCLKFQTWHSTSLGKGDSISFKLRALFLFYGKIIATKWKYIDYFWKSSPEPRDKFLLNFAQNILENEGPCIFQWGDNSHIVKIYWRLLKTCKTSTQEPLGQFVQMKCQTFLDNSKIGNQDCSN